MQDATNIAKQD